MGKRKVISKSKYIAGLQCKKYFWYQVNARDQIPGPGFSTMFIFRQGTMVGHLAKKLYPDGIDLDNIKDIKTQLLKTSELLGQRRPLFEGSCSTGNVYSRADILVPVEKDGWDIIEVKSSTQLKEVNIHDVSFQKYCFEKAGIKIRRCYLLNINNQYIREKEIDPWRLFKQNDITVEVGEFLVGIEDRIEEMLKIAASEKAPETPIGRHCSNPYNCPLKEKCWEFMPDDHVFNLWGKKDRAAELYREGIFSISDIPDINGLNSKQQIQVECTKTGKPRIDRSEISKFLSSLKYPLYFFDFETLSAAIPIYEETKPFQQIPFQYSIHRIDNLEDNSKHHDFLAEGTQDPRKELLLNLKEHLGDKGSILVYYESFEKGVLRELAETFPENKKWINAAIDRIVDLYQLFKDFYYYHPSQGGSTSLKNVLPAITDLSYKGMDIADGQSASVYFLYMCGNYDVYERCPTKEEVKRIRNSLIDYCRMDTGGMIHMLRALIKEVG